MIRDITMIVAVFIAVISVSFGVYKNFEAQNAKGFAFEQVYRVLNIVQKANISPFQRASIADAALNGLTAPAPVIDLSRSSADTASQPQVCTQTQKDSCTKAAADLADANKACVKKDAAACSVVEDLHRKIIGDNCIACFAD